MKTLDNTFFRSSISALEQNPFRAVLKSRPALIAAAAAFVVMTAGTMAFTAGEASYSETATVLAKSDRQDNALPSNCKGQAWGAWSADCVASLTDNTSTRQIRFVTAERPSSVPNVTILERIPANG